MRKRHKRPLFIDFARPRPHPKPGGEGGPVTTMMVGEESGKPDPSPMTTLALGEERGGR